MEGCSCWLFVLIAAAFMAYLPGKMETLILPGKRCMRKVIPIWSRQLSGHGAGWEIGNLTQEHLCGAFGV